MKNFKIILIFILFILLKVSYSQTEISGIIKDEKGKVIPGANVFLKNTFDGCTSDINGKFKFITKKTGEVILTIKYISFQTIEQKLTLTSSPVNLNITLKEDISELEAVTVSAGYFEAGDEKKSVMLNSLDIATTAGSSADIASAMRTLPGTQQVGNKTGLYVRGGEGREAVTVIDGLNVPHPFYSEVPDISERGRFSPFLFQGTYFSTGGYSAEYGQGMSSALILNTEAFPTESFTQLSLMSLGIGAGKMKKMKKTAIGGNVNYYNLNPYINLINQNVDWDKAVIGYDASLIYRQKTSETGLLKGYIQFDNGGMSFYNQDIEQLNNKYKFSINSNNLFSTFSYNEFLNDKWNLYVASSFSAKNDNFEQSYLKIDNSDRVSQGKIKLKRQLGKLSSYKFGIEIQNSVYVDKINNIKYNNSDNYSSAFIESDLYLTKLLVIRLGSRAEYSDLLKKSNIVPRTSLAYKTSENSQISLAYGQFYQIPDKKFIFNKTSNSLNKYEKSSHYITNYQWLSDDRSFRIEAFYKNYDNLIKTIPDTSVSGYGYAQGFDMFWRDKKTFKNIDYWISYSFLDSKRKYLNYPCYAVPDFAAKHTLSLVYKHFVPAIATTIGATYVLTSGRTYYNPNNTNFMSDYTKPYHNFSLSASYLTSIKGSFTVIVFSVNNVFGVNNILGYKYSSDGKNKIEINEQAKRMFFVGIFMSFGRDNSNDF